MFRNSLVWAFPVAMAVAVAGCNTTAEHAQNAGGQTAAVAPASTATERALPNRELRQRMIAEVEPALLFRGIIDGGAPRLLNARVSRAFEFALPFQGRQTFYCVSAEIEQPLSGLIPTVRTVSFTVTKLPDGTERLGPTRTNINYGPPECGHAKYEPFPELEQARAKRRLALGKPV